MNNRLRVLRAERHWTQAELAGRLGVSRETIVSLERGRYDPSLPLAFRISRLFGQAIEEIFIDDVASDTPSRDERKAVFGSTRALV